jgi:dihydroorotase
MVWLFSGHQQDIKKSPAVKHTALLIPFLFLFLPVFSQHIDLLIKGGHVIDPKNKIDDVIDVAVNKGKIVRVARDIDTRYAAKVIDARGLYVVPGLIDIHEHDFYGTDPSRHYCNGTKSIKPDGVSFPSGITTVADAGSSGWKDFPDFKKQIIDQSKTRVFAFLNIVGAGMRGGAYEQDTSDMDVEKSVAITNRYHKYIVGIKLAHYRGSSWKPVEEAIKAGRISGLPVMIDFGNSPSPMPISELFTRYMRKGDIYTHCFAALKGREPIVDSSTNHVKTFVWEAKNKGIQFDVGYGEISFSFVQSIPSADEGFFPNTISTDMHNSSRYKMKSLLEIMSEFLAMGMSIPEIINAVSWNPAKAIHHEELGNISVGAVADIAILNISNNKMIFYDFSGHSLEGREEFKCTVTIRKGDIVYKSN